MTTQAFDKQAVAASSQRAALLSGIGMVLLVGSLVYSSINLSGTQHKIQLAQRRLAQLQKLQTDAEASNVALEVENNKLVAAHNQLLEGSKSLVSTIYTEYPNLAEGIFTTAFAMNSNVASVVPRVYIKVPNSVLRGFAENLKTELSRRGFVVGSISVGSESPTSKILFYQDTSTDRSDAQQVAQILAAQGLTVTPKYVPGYENSTFMRSRHYDLVLGNAAAPPKLPPIKREVNALDSHGYTKLDLDVQEGDVASVAADLNAGADPNEVDGHSVSALFYTIWHGPGDTNSVEDNLQGETDDSAERYDEVALELLRHGANPNIRDAVKGETPLHQAAGWDQQRIVRTLLTHGADVNAQAKDGSTALDDAADYGDTDTIEILLHYHADPSLKDAVGHIALDYAAKQNKDDAVNLLKLSAKH